MIKISLKWTFKHFDSSSGSKFRGSGITEHSIPKKGIFFPRNVSLAVVALAFGTFPLWPPCTPAPLVPIGWMFAMAMMGISSPNFHAWVQGEANALYQSNQGQPLHFHTAQVAHILLCSSRSCHRETSMHVYSKLTSELQLCTCTLISGQLWNVLWQLNLAALVSLRCVLSMPFGV